MKRAKKKIGLTMAITAVLLAFATLLGHRAHTEEVVVQGDRNTQFVNYDTKTIRATDYGDAAKIAGLLPGGKETAQELAEKAKAEREGEPAKNDKPARKGAEKILERALELDREMKVTQLRANFYDASELFLEISIVLCSISLLAASPRYWKSSFITTAIGVSLVLFGCLVVSEGLVQWLAHHPRLLNWMGMH
ncbi:MAG TPA: DUF4337 family protein [Candidatus Angelobacter sp.]